MKKKMYILCQSYEVTAAYHSCGKKSAMPKGSLQKKGKSEQRYAVPFLSSACFPP